MIKYEIKSNFQKMLLHIKQIRNKKYLMSSSSSVQQQTPPRLSFKQRSPCQDTRHATTKNKIHYTPINFKRSPYWIPDSINQFGLSRRNSSSNRQTRIKRSMSQLEDRKRMYIGIEKYSIARKVDQEIKRSMSAVAYSEIKNLQKHQKKYRSSISVAHKNQMSHFQKIWKNYFSQLKRRQVSAIQQFKYCQKKQIELAKQRIFKKCSNFRVNHAELVHLQQKEQKLIQQNRLDDLVYLKREKNIARQRMKSTRNNTLARWTQIQENLLSKHQTKRYATLISKIDEKRSDKQKAYLRQRMKLKQKYKNVMQMLQHQQKMELNETVMRIKFK